MGKAFDSIKQGLTEAIVHRKGQNKGVKIHTPTEIDVQALRTRLGLTQEAFAAKFGISLSAPCGTGNAGTDGRTGRPWYYCA